MIAQDALVSLALQPGMVFRENCDFLLGEHPLLMCLATLKWGVLAWPMLRVGMDTWVLDKSGSLQWKFVFDVGVIEATEAVPVLDHDMGVSLELGNWEPFVKASLRLHSTRFTNAELTTLATIGFGMPTKDVNAMTKIQLAEALALKVGDEEFAKMVTESLKKNEDKENTQEGETEDVSELTNLLLEMLEPSDVQEFLDLKKDVQKKERAQKIRQWQQWRKEADDAPGQC